MKNTIIEPSTIQTIKRFRWRQVLIIVGVLATLRLLTIFAFRSGNVNWLRYFNKQITNRLALTPAGRRVYAVVHHVGRRSGKAYTTPTIIAPMTDGFVIPIAYGKHSDWLQNVLVAKQCTIDWHNQTYVVKKPEIVGATIALPAFPKQWQKLLRLYGINQFLYLKQFPE